MAAPSHSTTTVMIAEPEKQKTGGQALYTYPPSKWLASAARSKRGGDGNALVIHFAVSNEIEIL